MSDRVDFENTEPYRKLPMPRAEIEAFFEESKRSRGEILQSVAEIRSTVTEVKQSLVEFKASIADLITVFNSLKGLSNILVWSGKVIKPLLWIGGTIAAFNLYIHGIKIPKIGP